jgi:peroxiredoxin
MKKTKEVVPMSKLIPGNKMPDFTFDTIHTTGRKLYENLAENKTALVFLRYYGCTLCQYEILQLAEQYAAIAAKGSKAYVVLQSNPTRLAEQIAPDALPFEIICDPEMKLYKEFEILPFEGDAKITEKEIAKFTALKSSGLQHGEYEGEEKQLPALFILDNTGTVLTAHYAESLADMPAMSELAEML